MFGFVHKYGWAIILILAGIGWLAFPRHRIVEVVRRVTTVDTVMHDVPKVTLRVIDRIVYKVVPPETVLVSRQHTDTLIQEYCAAAQDTSPNASRLFLTAGRYDGTTLNLWGATTAEQAWHGAWGTRPTFEWTVSGDSTILREQRLHFKLNLRQNLVSFILGGAAALGVQKLLR